MQTVLLWFTHWQLVKHYVILKITHPDTREDQSTTLNFNGTTQLYMGSCTIVSCSTLFNNQDLVHRLKSMDQVSHFPNKVSHICRLCRTCSLSMFYSDIHIPTCFMMEQTACKFIQGDGFHVILPCFFIRTLSNYNEFHRTQVPWMSDVYIVSLSNSCMFW